MKISMPQSAFCQQTTTLRCAAHRDTAMLKASMHFNQSQVLCGFELVNVYGNLLFHGPRS